MAITDNLDPADPSYADQIRQRILQQQQGADPASIYMGGSPTFNEAAGASTPSPTFAPTVAAPQAAGGTANPNLLGPNYSGPAPASFGGPATTTDQVPVPSVNPEVVYTDQAGHGYDPSALYAAWASPSFRSDPANARVGDILAQYGFGPGGTAAAGAPAGASGTAATTAADVSPGSPSGPSAWQQSIRAMILQRLQQAGQPVDPNSPEIQATLEAARNEASRATDTERTALAERLYAQGDSGGLRSNALTQQIQQSGERNAQSLGGIRAQLLTNQYNQKRQELNQLLQLATQSGDAESAREIQVQLAQLQAAVQREGLGVNLAEFGATLNQNAVLAGLN